MNLIKITLKGVNAKGGRDFISALEDLPEETIQGNVSSIEAYEYSPTGGIILNIPCNEKESKTIKFNAPKNSKIVRESENEFEFNYNGRYYKLKKEVEGTCYP